MYKVLIVEDEDIIRKGLMFIMDWTQYDCTVTGEAVDGNDGLDKIARLHPDIVITDVKMPFKDGIQLLEESIQTFEYEAIIISGYSEFDYAKKAISLGVSDYLLKPVDMNSLGKTLKKVTEKIEKKRELKKYSLTRQSISANQIIDSSVDQRLKSKYVLKMLEYIEKHYKERISITDLCGTMGLTSTYLNSRFKEETHYTFNDYLNRYRILRAVEMLKKDEMKVYEIADAVGFQDYKYFIQVFKKYIGCPPIKFIHSCQ